MVGIGLVAPEHKNQFCLTCKTKSFYTNRRVTNRQLRSSLLLLLLLDYSLTYADVNKSKSYFHVQKFINHQNAMCSCFVFPFLNPALTINTSKYIECLKMLYLKVDKVSVIIHFHQNISFDSEIVLIDKNFMEFVSFISALYMYICQSQNSRF